MSAPGTVLTRTVWSYSCGAMSMPSLLLLISFRLQRSLPLAGSSAKAFVSVAP
jgi:hypothetical protein